MSSAAVDTNVLLCFYDTQAPARQAVAVELMAQRPVISAQVVSEYFNVLQRRFRIPKSQALAMGAALFQHCPIAPTTHATLALAARLITRYDFQLFDGIIIAAALETGCTMLYSADFQHQQFIEGQLRLVNPFR